VSVDITARVAGPGSDAFVDAAWELKERIRREEGVLKQRRSFFDDAYRRATVDLLLAGARGAEGTLDDGELVAFVATRRDGYILFLAVDPAHRGEGFGRRLVAAVAKDHAAVSCHARASNEAAIAFYEHVGFAVERRIDRYYEDGGAAYYLKLGDNGGLRRRLSEFVRK
jgi:ribosomal protein S18 acetylase RimI-like enzyme